MSENDHAGRQAAPPREDAPYVEERTYGTFGGVFTRSCLQLWGWPCTFAPDGDGQRWPNWGPPDYRADVRHYCLNGLIFFRTNPPHFIATRHEKLGGVYQHRSAPSSSIRTRRPTKRIPGGLPIVSPYRDIALVASGRESRPTGRSRGRSAAHWHLHFSRLPLLPVDIFTNVLLTILALF